MNIDAAFKGDYLAAVEFNGRTPTLTIDRVSVVELEEEDGSRRQKPVVHFREVKRGWVLCRTTAACLAAMWGKETEKWSGKRVTLRAQEVAVGPDRKPAIRVAGSPDLKSPVTFSLKLPRKRAQQITLNPTTAPATEPDLNPHEESPPAA